MPQQKIDEVACFLSQIHQMYPRTPTKDYSAGCFAVPVDFVMPKKLKHLTIKINL